MNTERADRVQVDLSSKNPFGLTFKAEDKNRSLFIEEPAGFGEGTPLSSQELLRTVMLAHLVIRHFPKTIETNYKVDHKIFLDELYHHYGFHSPKIVKSSEQVAPEFVGAGESKKEKISNVNAHSGGLDSVYRVATLLSQNKKVLITHLRNLNPKGNYKEALASRSQAKVFGVPYEEIKLRNGTDNTGFDVMRTRDMFLALVAAMAGEQYGIKKVFIEGDMQTDSTAHFSEYGPAWEFFNKLIKDSGLNSQVEGMDAHDIETVGAVIKLESELGIDILPLVQNCFSAEHQIHNNRRKWEKETTFLAGKSPDHWCGSCVKCRRMTLGRIYYHDPKLSGISDSEINFFVNDTYRWLENYPNNRALISESFLEHLDKLAKSNI
jgi:7-cyano-7-deazaguanine synthase in queuosine biosynthesis